MTHFTLFFSPLPIWDYWWALLFPLVIGIAIVYKGIKCDSLRQVPVQAAVITFWILLSLGAAGAGLSLLVHVLDR